MANLHTYNYDLRFSRLRFPVRTNHAIPGAAARLPGMATSKDPGIPGLRGLAVLQ